MWQNLQFPVDLVTPTEKILNAKNYLFFAVFQVGYSNFIQVLCFHMRSEPVRLGAISLNFAKIQLRWDENVQHKHGQMGQPGKVR